MVAPNTKQTTESIKTKFEYVKGKSHVQLDLMNASEMGWESRQELLRM
ncbi:hypothetical protein LINPERPRIM_LOCUS6606 [Linum perenne]